MCIVNNIWISLIVCLFILCIINNLNKSIKEDFYYWNIPTRWPRPIYDIRGDPALSYMPASYYFLHNNKIYDNQYIDIARYPELYYYLPYYNNGMIYTANGAYSYDQFTQYNNIPIIYPIQYNNIDWVGLINNGIIR